MHLPPITLAVNLAPFTDPGRARRQKFSLQAIQTQINAGIPLHPVNITFPDEVIEPEGWTVDASLQESSREIVDPNGPRFPFVRDIFDRAAALAEKRGHLWFAVMNSDILLTERLWPRLAELMEVGMETIAISRTEISDPDEPPGKPDLYIIGQDLWFVKTDWWMKNRTLFPNSLFPVRGWDVVYTSLFLCHSTGYLLNTEGGLCCHIRHPQGCGNQACNDFNFALEHGRWRIYSQRHNHYQYMTTCFFLQKNRMLNDEENARFISNIFLPPSPEEIEFSESLEKAFADGRRQSYMQVVI